MSKIEWTEQLLPMQSNMAFFTCWLNIKPVSSCISFVVVILTGLFATIKTRKSIRLNHPALTYSCPYGVRSLISNLFRGCKQLSFLFNSDMAADLAFRIKPVAARFVNIKQLKLSPFTTRITEFQPLRLLNKIKCDRYANTFGCYFQNSSFRTHKNNLSIKY